MVSSVGPAGKPATHSDQTALTRSKKRTSSDLNLSVQADGFPTTIM